MAEKNEVHTGSIPFETPIAFADGSGVFEELSKKYRRHRTGIFILAPSGVGKTHFIKSQPEGEWIDGDALWEATNAHPAGPWWTRPIPEIDVIDQRSDIITEQYRRLGFWIMGASCSWLKPDAVVLPHWSTHKRYIAHREKHNYDGGATSDRLGQVLGHRKQIREWTKQGVPAFKSVQEAADFLLRMM